MNGAAALILNTRQYFNNNAVINSVERQCFKTLIKSLFMNLHDANSSAKNTV
jgi:hypothetical protein